MSKSKNIKKYVIEGIFQGKKEEIDFAENLSLAKYLQAEYRREFGKGWIIEYKLNLSK